MASKRSIALLVAAAAALVEPATAGPPPPGRPTRLDTSAKQATPDPELETLRESARRPTADAGAFVRLGDALMQESRGSGDARLYEQAESAYRRALALDPARAEAMVGLAWVRNSGHDFDTGREWAEKALAFDPGLASAHALLGDAAVELGEYDEAFDRYQRALDLRPDLSTYSRAAHLLWVTGDTPRARRLMEKAVAAGGPRAENTAWCRAQLALMSFHTGSLLLAEKQAEEALRHAPRNPDALAAMGRIKTAKKDYAGAIDLYRRAAEIAPRHDALVALGDLYALTGDRGKAEDAFRRVVELHAGGAAHSHGGDAHAHPGGRGNAQLARFYADHDRNLDEALREAKLAYRTFKNVYVADTLAWCYYKKGDVENARRTIRRALRHNTPDAAILYHAGMIHAKAGDRAAARKYLYQALSLNPHFDPRDAAVASETLASLSQPPAGKPPGEPEAGARASARE